MFSFSVSGTYPAEARAKAGGVESTHLRLCAKGGTEEANATHVNFAKRKERHAHVVDFGGRPPSSRFRKKKMFTSLDIISLPLYAIVNSLAR